LLLIATLRTTVKKLVESSTTYATTAEERRRSDAVAAVTFASPKRTDAAAEVLGTVIYTTLRPAPGIRIAAVLAAVKAVEIGLTGAAFTGTVMCIDTSSNPP
jgi:hypothetical protein